MLKKLSPFLSYFIAILGSAIAVGIWYALINDYSDHFFVQTFKFALPWIVLIIGIILAILCAVALRLFQLSRERSNSLDLVRKDFKKEIIERMKAEESKEKLETALLQGQKLQAIGTLAGGIAHDFNNILYAIKGYVEMAREDVDNTSLLYVNLGKVLEAAQRGQELVARILTFGRRYHHHEYIPLQINTILDSVLSLLRPTVPSSVSIEITGQVKDKILGDQTQLQQVLVNIINNAVDAMEGEGKISIQVERIAADNAILQNFPPLPLVEYCKIDITDTGFGMDAKTLERIFEPFYTTKEVGKGTGLGLATAHGIIKDHQGEITVNSQLGKGTTFTILLPLHKPMEKD